MAPSEVQVTLTRAKHLKNVNWRNGPLRPYAVLWLDPAAKCSTRISADVGEDDGGVDASWDETVTLRLPAGLPPDEAKLSIDFVHVVGAGDEGTKPLIGSARLPLRQVLDEAGAGVMCPRSLKIKRPSGRPQGKVEVEITILDPRYYAPPPPQAAYAPPAAYGQPAASRDYGYPYAAAPPPYGAAPQSYATAATPQGYPYTYSSGGYGQPAVATGDGGKKGSKFGVGTGLAVGAVAGVLGGLALAEGVDYVEDKIEDGVAEKVEDDLAYDDGGDDGDW